jgi:uncharacterized membrane protein
MQCFEAFKAFVVNLFIVCGLTGIIYLVVQVA